MASIKLRKNTESAVECVNKELLLRTRRSILIDFQNPTQLFLRRLWTGGGLFLSFTFRVTAGAAFSFFMLCMTHLFCPFVRNCASVHSATGGDGVKWLTVTHDVEKAGQQTPSLTVRPVICQRLSWQTSFGPCAAAAFDLACCSL